MIPLRLSTMITSTSKFFTYLAASLSLIVGRTAAFVASRPFGSPGSIQQHQLLAHPLSVLEVFDATNINNALSSASSLILSEEALNAVSDVDVDTDSLLSGLRTFFAVLTALVFGAFGLTYFIAAVIVPKAAEQLEADTKRLRPGLWEEYEAKLEPGQTMATRPDILQELGEEMRPIILEDFERSAAQEEADKKAGVVDATIVEKKDDTGTGGSTSINVPLDTDNQWKD